MHTRTGLTEGSYVGKDLGIPLYRYLWEWLTILQSIDIQIDGHINNSDFAINDCSVVDNKY